MQRFPSCVAHKSGNRWISPIPDRVRFCTKRAGGIGSTVRWVGGLVARERKDDDVIQ